MAMNINNNGHKPLLDGQKLNQQQASSQQNTSQSAAAQQNAAASAPRQDSVSLTASAQQLSQLQKKSSEGSTVNQEKVDRLKKAIQSGEYKVNPERLANKIASMESELFGIK